MNQSTIPRPPDVALPPVDAGATPEANLAALIGWAGRQSDHCWDLMRATAATHPAVAASAARLCNQFAGLRALLEGAGR